MTRTAIFALAVGLAMDATAVSATRGMAVATIRPRHVLAVSLYFGGFQALMPLLGWALGAQIGPLVEAWDHWLAFFLLLAVGGKMVWEAHGSPDEQVKCCDENLFGTKVMTMLAIATSIDAFAVGITLPLLDAPLALSLITIGLTTAVLSAIGLFAGRRFGAALGQKLDVIGGLVLIGLGFKILVEHLSAR